MEEIAIIRDEKGKWVKGHKSPGPGRPKGSISIKESVRQYLEANPEEVGLIVEHFVKNNRELMWQMLEGKPQQDVTSGGEKIVPMPLLGGITKENGVQANDSPQETISPKEED